MAFRNILMAALMTVSLAASAEKVRGGGDWLPWPWGTECPFPWDEFDGFWIERTDLSEDLWQFKVLSKTDSGVRYFQIDRFNQDGARLAFGRGSANGDDRIIRAGMKVSTAKISENKKAAPTSNYWAIVRTYVEQKEKFDCVHDRRVMVLTLRPASSNSGRKDMHYVIRRVSTRSSKK